MECDKKSLKEQEIRTLFITPALTAKGWQVPANMREEYYFTAGQVLVYGHEHSRREGKKADYLLYHEGCPIAVVEAKDNKHAVGAGIQQAIDYAHILDLPFAYSSNGDIEEAAERKQAILDELKEYAILVDAVREANPALRDADIFDVICHVAYDQKPLTRRERASLVAPWGSSRPSANSKWRSTAQRCSSRA